ncbi:MAG: hypothetical protein EOO99_11970 [Pedobacter sp.]|nr:MAG: hypothetical protein EOO99_11970 [Pedobacter sp.]
MTYFKSLTTEEQQIDYILQLQEKIRIKFKNALKVGTLSSIEAKSVIDNTVWNNKNKCKHLHQITELVLNKIDSLVTKNK